MMDGQFHGEGTPPLTLQPISPIKPPLGTLYFPGLGRYVATWDSGRVVTGE